MASSFQSYEDLAAEAALQVPHDISVPALAAVLRERGVLTLEEAVGVANELGERR